MYINLRFLVPRKTGEVSAADVLDLYLRRVKEDLGLYTGRLLWTGNGISFTKTPLGKNMVGKVPFDMATHDTSTIYILMSQKSIHSIATGGRLLQL